MDTSNKHIWHITYPIIMTLLSQNIVSITDTAFLGHVGEVELGASAIGGVFYMAIYMIGFGFSQGSQILISRRNGEKRLLEIGKIFNNGLIFNFLLASVICLICYFSMSYVLKIMVSSEKIYDASIQFLNWRIFGLIFAFINLMFRAFFVGITKTKILSISSIITAVVNIILGYLLIFGKLGFSEMGIIGAAIASNIAEATTTIYLIIYSLKKEKIRQYNLFSFMRIDFQIIKVTLKISVYIMFQYFISVSTWFLFFIFIERIGERALAASNIGRTLFSILAIPGIALGTTTTSMISNLIGEGNKNMVIHFLKKILLINGIITIPIIILIVLFAKEFAAVFTTDADLILATVPVIQVISVSLFFFGTSNIIFNAVSATGNTKIAFIIELVVLVFYVGYIYFTTIIIPSSVAIVWFAEYIYWIMIGIMSFLYLKKGNWGKIKI